MRLYIIKLFKSSKIHFMYPWVGYYEAYFSPKDIPYFSNFYRSSKLFFENKISRRLFSDFKKYKIFLIIYAELLCHL